MHSVCCCTLPVWRRSFLKKGTRDLFLPRSAEKQQHLQGTMSTLSLPNFIKIHQAFLEKKLKMLKFTGGRRTTTTDGRSNWRTARYDNSSLEPSAQVSKKYKMDMCNTVGPGGNKVEVVWPRPPTGACDVNIAPYILTHGRTYRQTDDPITRCHR